MHNYIINVVMNIYVIGLVIVMIFGFIAMIFHTAVEVNIDRLEELINEPKSSYCNILKDAQQKHLKAIERLTPWRDATCWGFVVMAVLYLILLLFGN